MTTEKNDLITTTIVNGHTPDELATCIVTRSHLQDSRKVPCPTPLPLSWEHGLETQEEILNYLKKHGNETLATYLTKDFGFYVSHLEHEHETVLHPDHAGDLTENIAGDLRSLMTYVDEHRERLKQEEETLWRLLPYALDDNPILFDVVKALVNARIRNTDG